MKGPSEAKWITSPTFDLLIYDGACLLSYLFIYLHVSLGVSVLMLFWIWIMFMDGPHVFATISRTYLDAEERRQRARLLWGSLGWFLFGPVMLFVSIAVKMHVLFFVFLIFAQLWAYWHVVRQHYGFMVLYQKKNGEPSGKGNPYEYYAFYILMLAPFFSFLLRHPQARAEFGLPAVLSAQEFYLLYSLHGLIIATVLFFAYRQFIAAKTNLPKNIFLLCSIPLHMLIFLHPYVSTHIDLRLFAVFVTVYHNVQYQGIVWFYNRNRYHGSRGRDFGIASRVSRNFVTYYACGLLFTILYRYSNWFFTGLQVPFNTANSLSSMTIGQSFTIADLAVGFWWGFAFNHYYLDQRIWKVSKDKRLNTDLRLATVVS